MDRKVVGLFCYLSVFLCLSVIYLSIHLSLPLSVLLSICLSVFLSFYLSIYLSIYSICLSLCLSIYLSIYLYIYLSVCLFVYRSICVSNEATQRDFLNFLSWQHQKWVNSARLPSETENWVQSWRPHTNAFCVFSTPSVQSIAPATKWSRVMRSAARVTQNHLSNLEDLMLQNATLSGNQISALTS